ncbi:MAG: transposase [Candidatus Omnitrophica bacterium]|nr:transposase [Candidatus Omnitrophota bacterium]
MKRRIWTSKQKSQIVLEGLSGQIDITKLCQKYQVSQAQYYKWRDAFLQNCHQSFEVKKQSQKEQHLEAQNEKLKRIIGDLTIELKKSEYEL